MTRTPENLQQQADDIAETLCTALPDVPLPATTRLGCGYWTRQADGAIEYIYQGDGLDIEAFFRRVDRWCDLLGDTTAESCADTGRALAHNVGMNCAGVGDEPPL